jgi:hypothetical protein
MGQGACDWCKMLQAEKGDGDERVRRMQELLQEAVGDVARELGLMG